VTERKQIEEKLRISQERLKLAQKAGKIGSCDWQIKGRRVEFTEEFENVYGLPPGGLEGSLDKWEQFIHPEDLPRVRENSARELTEKKALPLEFRIIRPDGQIRWVASWGQMTFDTKGQPLQVTAMNMDITERRQMEEDLRQSRAELESKVLERTKALRELMEKQRSLTSELLMTEARERKRIAVDLHDNICQQLAIAKMRLQSLQQTADKTTASSLQEIGKLVHEAIQHTRLIMREISPAVLYELGLLPALDWLAEQMREKYGLKVSCRHDDIKRRIGDDIQLLLFQSVRELLHNIIKHAGTQRAAVHCGTRGGKIVLTVADEGKGFDPASSRQKVEAEDGGFGLFNIRERLRYFGGEMTIDTSPGKGCRIQIVAPFKSRKRNRSEEPL
ncbi:MAG: PAS domain-containing protein, partial [Smithellaceae bacterium]|nr:PAS domain-containing protein [Smithellaceae bacterium]